MATNSKIKRLHSMIREYVTFYLPTIRKSSPKTVRAYIIGLNSFRKYLNDSQGIKFTEWDFSHFSLKNVSEWLEQMKTRHHSRAATLNLRLAAVRGFIRFCSHQSAEYTALLNALLKIAKFEDKEKPTTTEIGVQYLTESQLRLLFSLPDIRTEKGRRDRLFMIFAYETGARLSELLGIKLSDLTEDNGRFKLLIVHGKGGKSRIVPVAEEVTPHIQAYLKEFHADGDPDDPFFYVIHDGMKCPMHDSTPAVFVREYGKIAHEQDVSFPNGLHVHMFRHSLGTLLYRKGVPLSYIADLLGHACLDTAKIYSKSDPAVLHDVIRKANEEINTKLAAPQQKKKWKGNEDELLRICGLK